MNKENPILPDKGLVMNDKIKSDLYRTAHSAKKMFVIFCLSFVNLILLARYYYTKGEHIPTLPEEAQRAGNILAAVACLLGIAVLIYPAIMLLRFSNATKKACLTDSQDYAERGLERLQSFLHFNGVLSIVLCALTILLAIIAAIGFLAEGVMHKAL